jgi:hypothetical protein
MKKINSAKVLDQAVSEYIPSSLDMKSEIMAQIKSKGNQGNTTVRKLTRAMLVMIILLTLLSITTIVYAIIQLSGGDPGLQSILQAGLPATLNVTARPQILPTQTPLVKTLAPLKPGISQKRSGVRLDIDSIYVSETRMELGLRFSAVPDGLKLGAPAVSFKNVAPLQMRGWVEQSNNKAGWSGYISYQVIHAADVNGKLNLSVDVPLLHDNGFSSSALDNFHFDLKDIPIDQGQNGMRTQQTDTFKVNGISLRLESLRVDEKQTEAAICQEAGAAAEIRTATIRLGSGQPLAFQHQGESGLSSCTRLTFPLGSTENGKPLHLQIAELAPARVGGTAIRGPWDFYADLPGKPAVLSLQTISPTSPTLQQTKQEARNVSITLDWAFVDARRAAVGYTISGLPDVADATGVGGSIRLLDEKGQPLGGAGIGSQSIERIEGQPGTLRGTYSVGFEQPLTQNQANFGLDITLDSPQNGDSLGYFPVSPQATPYPPGVFPPSLPDHLIGTFHFNFSALVYPMQEVNALPPLNAGGLEMRLVRAEVTASLIEVMLCYQKPSAADWGDLGKATIKNAAGDSASLDGYRLIYDSDFNLPEKSLPKPAWSVPEEVKRWSNGRCVLIDFLLGHSNRPGKMTLSIPDLQLSVPEVIPDDQIQVARQKLEAQGIEMDYTTATFGGGGGGGPRYNKLPDGMSEMEAYQRFMEALGYVHSGPWNFTFTVSP